MFSISVSEVSHDQTFNQCVPGSTSSNKKRPLNGGVIFRRFERDYETTHDVYNIAAKHTIK